MYEEYVNKGGFSLAQFMSHIRLTLIFFLSLSFFLNGCTAPTVTTGAFREVNRLEGELRRGVSTKMEVQRALGVPKGFGNTILPTDPRPREVWYYEDVEVVGTQFESGGILRANMRQQIRLVFFDKGVFDGYMLFSTEGTVTGK